MSEQQPTLDTESPLTKGHRWVWAPVFAAAGLGIVAQVILFVIDKASC